VVVDNTRVFGTTLRKIRKQQKLSQEAFGAKLGLHRTHISLLERGKRQPVFPTVLLIIEKLEITPTQFWVIVEDVIKSNPKEN